MAVVPFIYYMHDDYNSYERAEAIAKQTGIEMTEELIQLIGRPFYEVKLLCTLNTISGQVEILGVEQ